MKNLKIFLIVLFSFFFRMEVQANDAIIWSGDYETGDSSQWHNLANEPQWTFVPAYGRPPAYGGDGSLFSIVTNPVRQGKYAAKFTVKNSINGLETRDCDVPFPTCTRRRTEMNAIAAMSYIYNALPYLSERWISVSHYIPKDWNLKDGSGFNINVLQIKDIAAKPSPCFSIGLSNDTWVINHRWTDVPFPEQSDLLWQYQMFYDKNYPILGQSPRWDDGVADFVDPARSRLALGSVNTGGWTDWIINIKFDARGSKEGGTGFLKLWKREGNGEWMPILHIKPKVTNRGGMTFDHGICYPAPKGVLSGSKINGGFGMAAGMYMGKEQVWNLPQNRVIYNDNIKIGSEKATFAMMTPEYSGGTTPNPTPTPTPTGCHKLTPSSAIPPNYGSPYNLVINSQELLIKANCQSSGAQLNIGNNSLNQYIWSKVYIWRNNGWQAINLSGSTPAYNNLWFKGSANATVSLTSQEMSQENKIVAFVCNWHENKWKCGCRDAACGQMFWQLQNFGNY
jgi:hypothetical protein